MRRLRRWLLSGDGAPPWWYRYCSPALRRAYPGVPPWMWVERPFWLERVYAALQAEREADEAYRNQEKR